MVNITGNDGRTGFAGCSISVQSSISQGINKIDSHMAAYDSILFWWVSTLKTGLELDTTQLQCLEKKGSFKRDY